MEDDFDPRELFNKLRKSASVKTGAILFGQAQVAYYDVLKESMSEEMAYNMLAHTTECVFKTVSEMAGPVTAALLQAAYIVDRFEKFTTDKEMPGG